MIIQRTAMSPTQGSHPTHRNKAPVQAHSILPVSLTSSPTGETVCSSQLHFSGYFSKRYERHMNDQELKKLTPIVHSITHLEATVQKLSDAELKAKTTEFKGRIKTQLANALAKDKRFAEIDIQALSLPELVSKLDLAKDKPLIDKTLNSVLPEAFAVAREACQRVLKMRPYDVQVLGGIVLHQGKISEMRTGEGKTITAVMPAYLNALLGENVQIHTANDYLAQRDAKEMGPVFQFLGLNVGVVYQQQEHQEKRGAYQADITYGTGSEMAFDYLRDHSQVFSPEQKVQRRYWYTIVDEIDQQLIDEARTPHILSGQAPTSPQDIQDEKKHRVLMALIANQLQPTLHYTLDKKRQSVLLTDAGMDLAEHHLGDTLANPQKSNFFDLIQSIKAKEFFHKGQEYTLLNNQVTIVDELTGRLAPSRRWSKNLHAAIEAKELIQGNSKIQIKPENLNLASASFQSFYKLHPKLAGMTGTAATDAEEFFKIYGLPTVIIPTNRPYIRKDFNDVFCATRDQKYQLVLDEVKSVRKTGKHLQFDQDLDVTDEHWPEGMPRQGRPILIGTQSVEDSKYLSALFTQAGIPHNVLNAENHAKEAEIIAEAGRLNAVTIATNMAGRGVDIKLGGTPEAVAREMLEQEKGITSQTSDPEVYQMLLKEYLPKAKQQVDTEKNLVQQLGGLYVIGTERASVRRIDNQLAGRCARQGDPGTVRFFVSMEDENIKIFGQSALWQALESSMPLESNILDNITEKVQKDIANLNFDSRMQLLKYDQSVDVYRQRVYADRDFMLNASTKEDFQSSLRFQFNDALKLAVEELWPYRNKLSQLPRDPYERSQALADLTQKTRNVPPTFLVELDKITGVFDAVQKADKRSAKSLPEDLSTRITERLMSLWDLIGTDIALPVYRAVLLSNIDSFWRSYRDQMDDLVNQPDWGGDPAVEYALTAKRLFENQKMDVAIGTAMDLLPDVEMYEKNPQYVPLTRFLFQTHQLKQQYPEHWMTLELLQQNTYDFLKDGPPDTDDPDSQQIYLENYIAALESLPIPALKQAVKEIKNSLQHLLA